MRCSRRNDAEWVGRPRLITACCEEYGSLETEDHLDSLVRVPRDDAVGAADQEYTSIPGNKGAHSDWASHDTFRVNGRDATNDHCRWALA
jgi:hypothetical protein